MKFENVTPEFVQDLIPLVNSLGKLEKTASVDYTTKNGGRTKFSYVPLDDMLSAVKRDNNFAFMQPLGVSEDGTPYIQCLLIHKSGGMMISEPYRLVIRNGATKQDEGAEITYSRRYCMAAFFGIASDEDNDASGEKPEKKQPTQQSKQQTKDSGRKSNLSEETARELNLALSDYARVSGIKVADAIVFIETQVLKAKISTVTEKNAPGLLEELKRLTDEASHATN